MALRDSESKIQYHKVGGLGAAKFQGLESLLFQFRQLILESKLTYLHDQNHMWRCSFALKEESHPLALLMDFYPRSEKSVEATEPNRVRIKNGVQLNQTSGKTTIVRFCIATLKNVYL